MTQTSEYAPLQPVDREGDRVKFFPSPPELIVYDSPWYYSIRVYAPSITMISLMLGTLYFHFENCWDFGTSFYYAVTALFGVLYYVPTNANDSGNLFTILYYIYGAFFLAGVLGTYGGWLVANAPEIAAAERRKIIDDEPQDFDGDGKVGVRDRMVYWRGWIAYKIRWEDYSIKYLTLLAVFTWISIGITYGVMYESWTFIVSVNFAVGTLSAAGLVCPPCKGDNLVTCEVGDFRKAFLSLYILVGVPLFTMTLGQFADLMVKRSIARHEMDVLKYPLSEEEFRYASQLADDNNPDSLSLGEFTILELLRLGRVTTSDLDQIKELYDMVDVDRTGQVDKRMLVRGNLMKKYSSFDVTVRDRMISSDDEEGDHPHVLHMLTENDRANSLPPEFTEEMYHELGVAFVEEEGNEPNAHKHQRFARTNTTVHDETSTVHTDGSTGKLPRWMSLKEYNEIVIPLSVGQIN